MELPVKSLVLLVAMSLAGQAVAADWEPLGFSIRQQTWFIDSTSIAPLKKGNASGPYMTAWVKTYTSHKEAMFMVADCQERSVASQRVVVYQRDNSVASSGDFTMAETLESLSRVVPDSVGDWIVSFMCAKDRLAARKESRERLEKQLIALSADAAEQAQAEAAAEDEAPPAADYVPPAG